jgi:hypothetical protein
MAKKIIPSDFKTNVVDQLIESFSYDSNTSYYGFVADHISTGETEQEIVQPDPSVKTLKTDVFRNMIFGKRIERDDVRFVISRYNWEENSVYARYDDEDINLLYKRFYIMTDEGSFKHVYKCIDNANNGVSTASPVFNDIDFRDDFYETSDGYIWKYMYSINAIDFVRFSTEKFIPVAANNVVKENAKAGALSVIKIESEERLGSSITLNGKNYNNYILDGSFTDTDVLLGNTVQYRISSNATSVQGFYGNTIIQLVSGTGAGQFKRVVDSYLNQNLGGIFIQIDTAFSITPDATTRYEISPEVKIVGDGNETIQAFARAVVNANASNSVHRVEILNPGENYSFATAEVLKGSPAAADGSSVGILVEPVDAILKPIIPPPGGHGFNVNSELGAKAICINSTFAGRADGTLPILNSFAQYGIIKNPVFANVHLTVTRPSSNFPGIDGVFIEGETVTQFKKVLLGGSVSIQANTNIVVGNFETSNYSEFLSPGDFVYITSQESPDFNFAAEVQTIINNSSFSVSVNSPWSSNAAFLYYGEPISTGIINDIQGFDNVYLRNVDKKIELNNLIIGRTSFAVANVVNISINNKYQNPSNYNFEYFTQYIRCEGAMAGTFQQNEKVFQGENLENATFEGFAHSSNSTFLAITNYVGKLDTGKHIFSTISGAIMAPAFDKYNGDLDPSLGSVIYLQNEIPVTRNENLTEEIRVILEF